MLKVTSRLYCMSTSRWIQGTNTQGVNEAEPYHPAGMVFAGESKGRRVLPTFMKEEYDYEEYLHVGKFTRAQSDMKGGERKFGSMRKYNKVYELPGGISKRGVCT